MAIPWYISWVSHLQNDGGPLLLSEVGTVLPPEQNPLLTHFSYCSYFHGKWSNFEIDGVQYIHEDVIWRDSGFLNCSDVELLSLMYYAHFTVFGLYGLISVVVWAISLQGSICAPQVLNIT